MEHLLYEHTNGYLLFEMKEFEGASKQSYSEYLVLTQVVRLTANFQFANVEMAVSNFTDLCNNKLPKNLKDFLELNNVKVLHCDSSLKNVLKEINIKYKSSNNVLRGIRENEHRFLKEDEGDKKQFLLGVSHSLSRNKVEYNSKKEDNVIIHTVNMLEQIEKDINSYCMRIKELYGWSFPELFSACKNNEEYILAIRHFTSDNDKEGFEEVLPSERIRDFNNLKENSIGVVIGKIDMLNIKNLCSIIEEKMKIKKELKAYLKDKMEYMAPNLTVFLGDFLAAKIIVLSGGLLALAKCPSSTIQLLGAEKSLFKALKTRSDTPKYGALYHSGFILKTSSKNKAKLCRYVSAKVSILAKIDCFSESRTKKYGNACRKLVEKKIDSYTTNGNVENTDAVISRIYKKLNKEKAT